MDGSHMNWKAFELLQSNLESEHGKKVKCWIMWFAHCSLCIQDCHVCVCLGHRVYFVCNSAVKTIGCYYHCK